MSHCRLELMFRLFLFLPFLLLFLLLVLLLLLPLLFLLFFLLLLLLFVEIDSRRFIVGFYCSTTVNVLRLKR